MSFSKDFLWGAASASYQIEGAFNADGKGLNVWDALSEGKVAHGDNGNTACDHYNRFKEDVAIMKKLGLKSYRFSVSWARIFPDNSGKVNEKGLKFYIDLVEELKNAGIEPLCTLFHWDLPMWLHDIGGWKNPEIIEHFEKYTIALVKALSDKVAYWFTFNEPQCFIGLGYVRGEHAPFETTRDMAVVASLTKNVMLSHGRAVKAIRSNSKISAKIGFAPTCNVVTPLDNTCDSLNKAKEETFDSIKTRMFSTSWWSDPIVLGARPNGMDFLSDSDLQEINQPLDFYAYNIYNAANYYDAPNVKNPQVKAGMPRTTMNWVISPECMYYAAKFIYERYKLPIMVTENGMANTDFVMLDGKVHDPQRADYIHRYLIELKKAADEGIPIIGYQYWSVMDNFEWAEGFDKRFGLIHIDYETRKRTIKDSAYFYSEVIKTNGENL